MRSTQKSFIDKMRKTVLSLNTLTAQANVVYDAENDTHNHLKQVSVDKEWNGDREQAWLDGCQRERAQNAWLLALVSKEEIASSLLSTYAELKELAMEAIELIASAGEGNDDFVAAARVLTVLASVALFDAERWSRSRAEDL